MLPSLWELIENSPVVEPDRFGFLRKTLDEAWALNDLHKTDEAFEIALKALDE
jgi:hypothetical protein